MKKVFISMMMSVVAVMAWGCSTDHDSDDRYDASIRLSELPDTAREFIAKYYPEAKILKIDREGTVATTAYDVEFTDGAEVEFDATGLWTDVSAPKGKAIPTGIVLPAIDQYVSGYYPGAAINEIERIIPSGYEVDLTNRLELIFTQDGTFLSSYD